MFVPDFFRSIQSQPIREKITVPLAGLAAQLRLCHENQFTGQLIIKTQASQNEYWYLYFYLGYLAGGTSPVHPIRRWRRQITQHCPQLIDDSQFHKYTSSNWLKLWNYESLIALMKQGRLLEQQMVGVVEGNLVEILFDLMQSGHSYRHGAQVQLLFRPIPQAMVASLWITARLEPVLQQTEQLWSSWSNSSMGSYSPNLAPAILDRNELRLQTSETAFQNLTAWVNGDRTLRDLSVQLNRPLVSVAQSILPHVHEGMMGLVEVKDFVCDSQSMSAFPSIRPVPNPSVSPLIAYIEDSRFDCAAMSQVLAQLGYRFINIRDPLEALPILLEQKPNLIFLDLLMPIANGYEICSQIRRVSAFKDTPIVIVTSINGIVDRVRAKLVGSSDFLSKPITSEKVLGVLNSHLQGLVASDHPKSHSPPPLRVTKR